MGKNINFDLFMQEHEKETISVTIFGEEYTVPKEIPAIIPVMMARAEESMSTTDRTYMVMRAADAMFGAETVNKLCRKGLSVNEIGTLIETLFAEITGGDDEDDEVQELDDESGKVQSTKGKRAKK